MKLCRYDENRLGLVEEETVADVCHAISNEISLVDRVAFVEDASCAFLDLCFEFGVRQDPDFVCP